MSEHIVGMMWNKNEGDILPEIIASALEHVDTLVIADDGSSDNSWDIIQGFASAHRDQIEHIRRDPNKRDKAQRQALLDVIRDRYRAEDTWVQIIESDIMIMDTDVRQAIKERHNNDTYVEWSLINAVIPPTETWEGIDDYPNWKKPIQEILTHGHWIENMTYTFRPHSKLYYDPTGPWRPWPKGFSHYGVVKQPVRNTYTPLLAHYGYRGPTHLQQKFLPSGTHHKKYTEWDFTSPESVLKTVYFYNGVWNANAHIMSRHGYITRKDRTNGE